MVCGTYVSTFAEASHALPSGMHMNSDYPFMLPTIIALTPKEVTIRGSLGKTATAKIRTSKDGRQFFELAQISCYEVLFNKKPTKFKFHPFKDEKTPPILQPEPGLFPSNAG